MSEVSLDARILRAEGLGKVSFHFYFPKVTFARA